MESQVVPKPCRIDNEEALLSSMEMGIYIAISSIGSILAITGNGLVILLVYKKRSLRNASNFFLCSLAVADLWAGFVPIPIATSVVWLDVSCNTLTKLNDFLGVHILVVTALNLSAVSIDRLIAVKWPLRYPSIMKTSTTRRALLVIWVTSIVFAIPTTCVCCNDMLIYWLFISVLTILIPFLVILYCYSAILKISSQQQQRIIPIIHQQAPHDTRNGRHLGVKKNRKAMTRFLAVISLLILALLPNLICAILIMIPFKNCPSAVQAILNHWDWSVLFFNLSPFLNPCIYALSNRQYRSAFKNIIKRENGSNTVQMLPQAQ
uniref:Trace amine-associated receptor 7d-like n=1 Tax=Actinia tenebrosa TaxID=6105 RepID=A0A6P8HTI0_ACTTE